MDFLVIDLEEGTSQQKLLVRGIADGLEHVSEAPGNDSLKHFVLRDSDHRMGLSAASLSVGEDSPVVSLKDVFYEGVGCLAVDFGLL